MAKVKYTKQRPRGKPFPKGDANPKRKNPKRSGRQKGTPNKWTRDIREAVLNALERLGGDDYLVMLGQRERRAFANLLGKAMPLQVTGAGNKALIPSTVSLSVNFVKPEKK